jgi:hypothetical protein
MHKVRKEDRSKVFNWPPQDSYWQRERQYDGQDYPKQPNPSPHQLSSPQGLKERSQICGAVKTLKLRRERRSV